MAADIAQPDTAASADSAGVSNDSAPVDGAVSGSDGGSPWDAETLELPGESGDAKADSGDGTPKPCAEPDCDDGNPCTDDKCAPLGGCQHSPHGGTCSDGDACTVGDVCAAAVCQPGSLLDADGDGAVPTACGGQDCDDGNLAVKPGGPEVCGNGKDDNCDGVQDEGCAPQSPVGCNVDGLKCGGGIGTCAKGHCRYTDRHGYAWTLVPAGKF